MIFSVHIIHKTLGAAKNFLDDNFSDDNIIRIYSELYYEDKEIQISQVNYLWLKSKLVKVF